MLTSPKTTGKPFRACVDTAPAHDEITERLIQVLVLGHIPQHPRPLTSRPLIDLGMISRAKDHGGKRFRLPYRFEPSQVQRPMSTVDCLTLLVSPFNQFKNGGQISIDRTAIPAGLNLFPFILQPQQVGFQCFG
jgi:hypothetical protein